MGVGCLLPPCHSRAAIEDGDRDSSAEARAWRVGLFQALGPSAPFLLLGHEPTLEAVLCVSTWPKLLFPEACANNEHEAPERAQVGHNGSEEEGDWTSCDQHDAFTELRGFLPPLPYHTMPPFIHSFREDEYFRICLLL